MMKPSRSKSIFHIFTLFTLLTMLFGILPVSPAQAEAPASPLLASGDFAWAKGMGGTMSDQGYGIAVDSSGNVYTTGEFEGTVDFDPGSNIFNLTSFGSSDIFISKLDSNGNFIWAKQLGGDNFDLGSTVAIDSNGNIYITGVFSSIANFDPGTGTYNLTSAGSVDAFVCKLDPIGNFIWAKRMGGPGDDGGTDLVVDASGAVYTIGTFSNSADFDPGVGIFSLTSAGLEDIYVSKLNAAGGFVWAAQVGGTGYDSGYSIVLDSAGNIYTTGHFKVTTDFDPGAGIFNLTSAGGYDIFISKLDMNGSLLWAKRIGAASDDNSFDIAVDSTGNVYTTGFFQETSDFDPDAGIYNLTSAGFGDIFVSKLSTNGNFVWAKGMGGVGDDQSRSIGLDSVGNVYTTGHFRVTGDFDPGPGTFYLEKVSNGSLEMFDSKLDANGNFVWAKGIIGATDSTSTYGTAIATGGNESIYWTGLFSGTADFDPGTGTANLTSAGDFDIFVSKLGSSVIFVDWNASGANSGASWSNAYSDLQSALSGASSGDEVWVAAGTYKPTTGSDRAATFQLKDGVAVYGGFTGTESALDERDPAANVTILSGDLNGDDSNNIAHDEPTRADNSYHVVSGATGATLNGFTVTAGNANGSGSCPGIGCGGGLLNTSDSSPVLTNLTFNGNSAIYGGGIFNSSSSPTLTNITLNSNSAATYGGGMYNLSSSPMLTNVTFNSNFAGSYGGGMFNDSGSSPTLTNLTFNGNSATTGGGGMSNYDSSSPQIRNTIFWGNTAATEAEIYNNNSIPGVSDSVIQGGYAGGTNIITADPLLGTLGDYGGYTDTIPLLPGSSAINAGNDTICPATDQRGVTRPQGSSCDIGSYEYNVNVYLPLILR